MESLKLLSKIILSFQNADNFDNQIELILKDIGVFTDVSRIYIFFNEYKNKYNNTYEWCNEGIIPNMLKFQDLSYEDMKIWIDLFRESGYIRIEDRNEFSSELLDEIEFKEIKSLISYPLVIQNKIRGFIGFNEHKYKRKWTEEELEILGTVSLLVANAYERKFDKKELEEKHLKLENTIKGARLATWEWNLKTDELQVNEEWANIIGYSLVDLEPVDNNTWLNRLHPKDLEILNENMNNHLKGETEYYDCVLRIKHRSGKWIWIHDKGKVIERDKNGSAVKMFGTHSDITNIKEADQILKESEKRFFLALDKTKAGLWDMNMITGEVFFSRMWKQILGYKEEELENSFETWKDLWHPDDKRMIQNYMKDYSQDKIDNHEIIHRLKHKDGSWRWILNRGGVLRDDNNELYRWIGTHTDVTTEYEQSLELEKIFSVNLDLLCILDMNGKFLKTNKAWKDVLGYDDEELMGHKILEFIHKNDINDTLKALDKLKEGKKVDDFINRYKDIKGNWIYLQWRANPFEGKIYAAARDITDRIEYEKKILEISNKDSLTNTYNRRYIFNRINEIVKEYKKSEKIFSICIIDIDHFKNINDSYGHQTGDRVLKEFTNIIKQNLRPYDVLGRYGGEEFMVILNNADRNQSGIVIKRILETLRNKTFIIDGDRIDFTFSAGIVNCKELRKDKICLDKLIELADKRMYQAKNTGRNKIIF